MGSIRNSCDVLEIIETPGMEVGGWGGRGCVEDGGWWWTVGGKIIQQYNNNNK